ncbi:hypothetical protein RQP46_001824 [Phenoliferia psychrophenolica]
MPAVLRRSPSTSSSSASEYSTAASSTLTSPSTTRKDKPTGIPNHGQSGQLQSSESRVRDLTTSDLQSLLATRLANERRKIAAAAVGPAPPAYPYSDLFLPRAPKVKAPSNGAGGKKKVFGLFGGGGSKSSNHSTSTLSSSPAPSINESLFDTKPPYLSSMASSSRLSVAVPATPKPVSGSSESSIATSSLVGRRSSDWSQLSSVSTDASSVHSSPSQASTKSSTGLRVISDEPVSTIPADVQKVLDQATKMLGQSLKLSLVYLVSLDLASPTHTLTLLASFGLPTPAPTFDPALHFKALRAPEGGLLFQNTKGAASKGFKSGLLVPILEVRQVGYCLCGYTFDQNPTYFGQREMEYFTKFAEQLEPWVSKIGRT